MDFIFGHSAPLSDRIRCFGWKPPRYLFFMISGMIGDIFTFSLYFLMVKTYFTRNEVISKNVIYPILFEYSIKASDGYFRFKHSNTGSRW